MKEGRPGGPPFLFCFELFVSIASPAAAERREGRR